MIYKIRYNCTKSVQLSLYFSLFNSHLSYGLSVWGTSNDGYLLKLELQQKKVIRAITFSDFYAHTSPLFKSLNVLKTKDLFSHKIGSLMCDFDHHSLPDSLASMFTRRKEIHNLNLRDQNKNKLYTEQRFNNRYGYDSFSHRGSLLINKLKDLPFYGNSYSKSAFMAKYKAFILENY